MRPKNLRPTLFSLCIMTMPLMCTSADLPGAAPSGFSGTAPTPSEPPTPSMPETEVQPKKIITSKTRPMTTHLLELTW